MFNPNPNVIIYLPYFDIDTSTPYQFVINIFDASVSDGDVIGTITLSSAGEEDTVLNLVVAEQGE